MKDWRNRNIGHYAPQAALQVKKQRDRAIIFVINLLENSNGCVDCGEKDFRTLDFDHLPQFKKEHNIAVLKNQGRIGVIKKEISKCEIRCANCHRKKTAERNPLHWFHRYRAGSPGLEPRQGESKSPVLPLHHEPIRRGRTPGVQLLLI